MSISGSSLPSLVYYGCITFWSGHMDAICKTDKMSLTNLGGTRCTVIKKNWKVGTEIIVEDDLNLGGVAGHQLS